MPLTDEHGNVIATQGDTARQETKLLLDGLLTLSPRDAAYAAIVRRTAHFYGDDPAAITDRASATAYIQNLADFKALSPPEQRLHGRMWAAQADVMALVLALLPRGK